MYCCLCVHSCTLLSSMPTIHSVDSLIMMFITWVVPELASATSHLVPVHWLHIPGMTRKNWGVLVLDIYGQDIKVEQRSFHRDLFGDINQTSLLLIRQWSLMYLCTVITECNEDGTRIRNSGLRPRFSPGKDDPDKEESADPCRIIFPFLFLYWV